MNAGFFTAGSQESLPEMMLSELMSHGLTVYQADVLQDIYNVIVRQRLDCVFLNINVQKLDWLKFIRFLKKNPKTATIHIMVFTSSDNKAYLKEFVDLGINGIFHTYPPLTSYTEKIKSIVGIFESEISNKRKFVRVETTKDDPIPARLELPERIGVFRGKVEDISVVAASITMENPSLVEHMEAGSPIHRLELDFDGIVVACTATVIRKIGEDLLIVEFADRDHSFNKEVVTYIYNKINY